MENIQNEGKQFKGQVEHSSGVELTKKEKKKKKLNGKEVTWRI